MKTVFDSSRRHLLRSTLGGCATLAAGLASNLVLPARAAYAADYKALVCIFLYGGNDGMNTIVPVDAEHYALYSSVRKNLAIPAERLLPLAGSTYGLHPSLRSLQPAWTAKRLAPVFNVGPLYAPLTKADYRNAVKNSVLVPENLYSHADQQILWETASSTKSTRTGWGGRTADALATPPVISAGANGRFGLSDLGTPLVVPEPGTVFGAYELAPESWRLQQAVPSARANALRFMYRQLQSSDLGDSYTKMQREAFDFSERLGALVKAVPGDAGANAGINAGFAPLISGGQLTSSLAKQLYQIAKLIDGNAIVGGSRQVFFAQLGGFDTHAGQVGSDPTLGVHAALLQQLGDALAAFDAAMRNIGKGDAVTVFTQSDFGRTFKPNNSAGTDHAWGNHHLVLGGAVKGGATYGSYPELVLGGANDVGTTPSEQQGRWIPTASVDQYAATLLTWFGADDGQLDAILPNLRNFGAQRRLGFMS